MKKLLVLLLCVISLQSFSQFEIKNLTFSGGLGGSTIFGSPSWNDPVALQVSIETKIVELNDNASISSGLGFSYQGAGYEEQYFDELYEGKVRLAYLNVPVIFNYQTDKGFYGEGGLQPGFLLSAKDKYDGNSDDWSDYVSGFELGLLIGGGYFVNEQVAVGGRITYGATNLYSGDDSDDADHNFMFVALVRFFLDLD